MAVTRPSVILLCLALLAGCATPPPQPAPVVERKPLAHWTLAGRISVQTATEGWHGRVFWQQDDDAYQLNFSGPLGQGAMTVRGGPGGVVLRSAGGEVRRAMSPEALLQEARGWHVPVDGMRWWVTGRPVPGDDPVERADADGLPARLVQSGWDIRLADYAETAGHWLPRSVDLVNGDLSVRLRINRWEPRE